MSNNAQIRKVYDDNAQLFAKKFDDLGARKDAVEETFDLIKKDNPYVLEIGCGNGRDAKEIIRYTNRYVGIDISEKLIEIAQEKVPRATFEVADIENYTLPAGLDIIFAFASLIHISKNNLAKFFTKAHASLAEGGIVRLSLKYTDTYTKTTKEDEFGSRILYLYSKKDIEELADGFTIIRNELHTVRNLIWLEVMLQKKS